MPEKNHYIDRGSTVSKFNLKYNGLPQTSENKKVCKISGEIY